MKQATPVVIIGGNNPIGAYLMPLLHTQGQVAEVISRRAIEVPEGFTVTTMDLTTARNWIAPENAIILSLLPLWVLAQFLPRFIGVKAIIAVGSTSLFTKADSVDQIERSTAQKLQESEAFMFDWCARGNISYTLLRPTLVYDGKHDKNIARMAQFIRRYHMLPLAAPAKGLRQPIHAEDVAKAVIGAIGNAAAENKAFNIAGGEVLTYHAMAERVFAALGKKPRFIMLPTDLLQKAFRGAARIGILRENSFGSSIFQRMNQDLIFDVAEGLEVLRYEPRRFMPVTGA